MMIFKLRKPHLNTMLFSILLISYSFTSPWPKTIGFSQVISGVVLIILFGGKFINFILREGISIEKIFLLYGIFVFSWLGVINNEPVDIFRDMLPFLFIFIGSIFRKKDITYQSLYIPIIFLVLLGLIYTVRTLFYWRGSWENIGQTILSSPNYIAFSPSLVFSCVFLICFALNLMLIDRDKMLKSFFFMGLGILPLIVFFGQIVRAPVGLSLAFIVLYVVKVMTKISVNKQIFFGVFLILTVMPLSMYSYDVIVNSIDLLIQKQLKVGSSGKLEEYVYAFSYYINDPYKFIFGSGFGGLWKTPFDENINYSFAHSILVYFFIKGGLIGFLLALIMTVHLIYMNVQLIFARDRFLALTGIACMPSLLINLFLEPGFKVLSFGFILLVIRLAYQLKLQNNAKQLVIISTVK